MSRKFVREGNLLASRLILMLWICASRGLIWLVEQPEGSVFNLHPRWQEFVAHCPVPRQNLTNMFVSKNQQWLLPKGIHIAMFLLVWHPKRAPTTLKTYQQKFGKTLLEHVIVRIFLVANQQENYPRYMCIYLAIDLSVDLHLYMYINLKERPIWSFGSVLIVRCKFLLVEICF